MSGGYFCTVFEVYSKSLYLEKSLLILTNNHGIPFMIRKALLLFGLGFASFYTTLTNADVLFIDFNNSKKEIDAARKASQMRGEKLIVFPMLNDDDAKLISQLKKELSSSKALYHKCGASPSCDKFSDKVILVEARINEINSKYALNPEGIQKQLAQLDTRKINLSSVVISGHDGNAQFFGTNGAVHERDLEEAFKKCSPVGDSVRSVMLWGCYTANIGSISNSWKKMLPNIELIAGFDGVAPSGEKLASSQYLEDILVQEKKLTAIKDKKQLQAVFKSLKSVPTTNASLCTDNAFVTNKLALSMDEINKVCGSLDFEKIVSIFNCYKNAVAPNCVNPPQNTSSGELRLVYNKLQETRHCWEWEAPPDFPSLDVLIRLIFFDNVKKNILKFAKDDFKKLDELMIKLGAPSDLRFSDWENLNRSKVLDRITKINKFIESIIGPFNQPRYDNPLAPEAMIVKDMMYGIQNSFGEMVPLVVPFDWVEPTPVSKPLTSFSFDENKIRTKRMMYENDRAQSLLKSQLVEIVKKEPRYEELKRNKIELDRLEKDFAFLSINDESKKVELRAKINENIQRSTKVIQQVRDEHLNDLQILKQNLVKQPYAHAEGKIVFAKSLESIDIKTLQIELDDCI